MECDARRFDPVFDAEFVEDVADVEFYRALRDIELFADFSVGSTVGEKLPDLFFSRGQALTNLALLSGHGDYLAG